MGMLEDDLTNPHRYPNAELGDADRMRAALDPDATRIAVARALRNEATRIVDTRELGPIKVVSHHRQRDAVLVREALEAAARSDRDEKVVDALLWVVRYADTETLAYIRRLLKG